MSDAASPQAAAPVRPAWVRAGRLFVIGMDGLSPAIIEPMAARGELPNLARLMREGCYGPLQTISPTSSPLIWTTIASGRHHRDHTIDGFTYYEYRGKRVSRETTRRLRRWRLKWLLKLGRRFNIVRRGLLTSDDVHARRFWDIFSDAGRSVVVVNWWNTWPANAVNGMMISDRAHHWHTLSRYGVQAEERLTHPEALMEQLRPLVLPPQEVTGDMLTRFVKLPPDELRAFIDAPFDHRSLHGSIRFFVSMDLTMVRLFEHCLDAQPKTEVATVYLRTPDLASHRAFEFMPSATRSKVTDEERRRFGDTLPEAYRFSDELLGRMLSRLKPGDTVAVLSDHGYGYQEERDDYGHELGRPPGTLCLMGPEFQAGRRIDPATVYDILPTLLRVSGFPAAQDMPGRCLEELLTPEFQRQHPPLPPVPSYGERALTGGVAVSGAVDADVKAHLKGLGYID